MANNQFINKVIYGTQTLIDLTGDTIRPEYLLSGFTAHDASGALIVGTLRPASQIPTTDYVLDTDYLFIERNGTLYKVLASQFNITPSTDGDEMEGENGDPILSEGGEEIIFDTGASDSDGITDENGEALETNGGERLEFDSGASTG